MGWKCAAEMSRYHTTEKEKEPLKNDKERKKKKGDENVPSLSKGEYVASLGWSRGFEVHRAG
jgi:hypothetical protein